MKATLRVYVNSDDALLRWSVDELDPRCAGFAVQRRHGPDGAAGEPEWLDNYAPPGVEPHQRGERRPSAEWPFRGFSWTDHAIDHDAAVGYRVVPVLAGTPPVVREDLASAWSAPRATAPAADAAYEASFNRGFVISQFISRYLDEHFPGLTREQALRRFKAELSNELEDRVRVFLAGQLRARLLSLLREVQDGDGQLFGALFELGDRELITALGRIGARAHVVLANGSIEGEKGVTASEERTRDENEDARRALVADGVDVTGRFTSPKPLAHNKFLVVTTAAGEPRAVWTGSTNWTTTGLCTQLNNGLLVRDPAVAALYLKQWEALRAAGNGHPRSLTSANGGPGSVGEAGARVRASVHFTRARNGVDLAALREIVSGARQGVLFLMFIPGAKGTLADVLKLSRDRPELLVRGVVTELPRGRDDEKTGTTTRVRVRLVGPGGEVQRPRLFDVVQPRGMAFTAAGWALETTRKQFLDNVGHAIIHSKVLVVDPFSDDPTVVTGSHNFSLAASQDNDENFIVVRGDRALAEAYAVNIESAWRHYAARAGRRHAGLVGNDYLQAVLADQRREERFWQI